MALETLKGVTEIGGFKVVVMDELRDRYPAKFNESGSMDYKWFEKDIRPNHFIYLRHDVNSISFTIQNGPIKEVGVNGAQVDSLIHAAKAILEGLNKAVPASHTTKAIGHLNLALAALQKRTEDRNKRNVEGTNKV